MIPEQFSMSTWTEAERFYERLSSEEGRSIGPMLDLVRFVASSPLAKSLFPAASQGCLRIGRVPHFAKGSNELQITFDTDSQVFTFTYKQHLDEANPWSRSCAAEDGRFTFERLLHKRLRWFHEG